MDENKNKENIKNVDCFCEINGKKIPVEFSNIMSLRFDLKKEDMTTEYKEQIHMDICEKLNDMYSRKNNDYGDSFTKTRDLVPNAILVRILDKTNRLSALMTNKSTQKVQDEKIEDTLMDLANYCIMELIERTIEEGGITEYLDCLKTIE